MENLKKNCENCAHFSKRVTMPYGKTEYSKPQFFCKYHSVEVTYPSMQYCGDDWTSPTAKRRQDKLNQLGI